MRNPPKANRVAWIYQNSSKSILDPPKFHIIYMGPSKIPSNLHEAHQNYIQPMWDQLVFHLIYVGPNKIIRKTHKKLQHIYVGPTKIQHNLCTH